MDDGLKKYTGKKPPYQDSPEAKARLEQKKRDLAEEKVRNMRIVDSVMFQYCAKNNPKFVESILNPVLWTVRGEDGGVSLESVSIENIIPNAGSRGIRIDALGRDRNGKYYLVEMQRESRMNELKYRARFYRALGNAPLLREGQKFSEIPDMDIVFVCEHDPRKGSDGGRPYYESCEVWRDTGEPVNDGETILYTNGDWRANDYIGNLNHDILCRNADDVYDETLRKTFQRFKAGGKDVETVYADMMEVFTPEEIDAWRRDVKQIVFEDGMEKGMEKGMERGMEKGMERGRMEEREGIFKSMILDVLPSGNKNAIKTVMGQISRIGKLSTGKIQSIVQLVAKENNLKIPDGLFDDVVATDQPKR